LDCPGEETILAFAEGRLPAETFARVQNHALRCRFCQDLVAVAVGTGAVMRSAAGSASVLVPGTTDPAALDDFSGDALARGTTIGRYTILALVGRGGVGEVYAAYDPELDRKVALKLLRAGFGPDRATAQARLLREAKAIAKLSHPNVVAVYDAGTFLDRVFIAMEFVDGPTLKDWLSASPRSRAEILDAFVPAARGLSAAHAAGLVHRDFKPQNVMIAKDGTIRVMDFGLARQMGQGDAPRTEDQTSTANDRANDERFDHWAVKLTQTGIVQGTPAYMAPEQFSGQATDARTDQFSFCVALYEALYGQRPFAGDTLNGLMTAVAAGTVRDAPAGAKVPAWLRRILLRGLQPSPELRFPSLETLLAALQPDQTLRRRRMTRAFGAITILCLIGVAAGTRRLSRSPQPLCLGGAQKLAGIWEPGTVASARKDQIHRAFISTGKSYAEQAFTGAANFLDAYLGKWLEMYRDTCEATHLRGEQSVEVLDLRMRCLDQRIANVHALTNVFAIADGSTVENAITATGALPRLDHCADVALLKAVVQPPRDEATKARVELLRAERARLVALRDSGHCQDAERLVNDLLPKVRGTQYQPLLAETLMSASLLQACTSPTQGINWLREAFAAATESHDDETAAEAVTLLSGIVGDRAHDEVRARVWLDVARASISRVGQRPLLEAWWLVAEGNILLDEGRNSEAVAVYQKALAAKQSLLGKTHPDVLISMLNVGVALEAAGRLDEALASYISTASITQRTLGPEHPMLAWFTNNEGEVLNLLRRYAEARVAYQHAIDLLHKAGSDAENIAAPLTGLGVAYLGEGHAGTAIAPLEEALKIRIDRQVPPELLGETRFALARALWSRPPDRGRARSLARAARTDYSRVTTGQKPASEIDAWFKRAGS
jgi:tetratricopeptide (TPR) repeat protein/predicted Ser/Thr protein kinase